MNRRIDRQMAEPDGVLDGGAYRRGDVLYRHGKPEMLEKALYALVLSRGEGLEGAADLIREALHEKPCREELLASVLREFDAWNRTMRERGLADAVVGETDFPAALDHVRWLLA